MKVALHSDLHLEGNRFLHEDFLKNQDYDVLILAGDISSYKTFNWAFEDIRELNGNKPVIFVPGNHEFYRAPDFYKHVKDMREKCDDQGIHFLYRDSVEIDGVQFIGCTGWSDLTSVNGEADEATKFIIKNGINDFRLIGKGNGDSWTIEDMLLEAEFDRQYLESELELVQGLTSVVVTHFSPSLEFGNSKFPINRLSAYFSNDYSDLFYQYQPTAWVYGHTHGNDSGVKYQTPVYTNQHGYGKECEGSYNPNFIFEV